MTGTARRRMCLESVLIVSCKRWIAQIHLLRVFPGPSVLARNLQLYDRREHSYFHNSKGGGMQMPIVLVRVDDRLIHGQVAVGWTRTVGATRIVVANDEVAKDATQKALLKLAAPVGVKVSILSVADAAALLAGPKVAKDRVMVLVRDPQSLLGLMDGGVELTKVNVGNVRMAPGRVRLTKEVAASPEELEAWKELDRRGVILEAVWLPGGAVTDFNNVLRQQ